MKIVPCNLLWTVSVFFSHFGEAVFVSLFCYFFPKLCANHLYFFPGPFHSFVVKNVSYNDVVFHTIGKSLVNFVVRLKDSAMMAKAYSNTSKAVASVCSKAEILNKKWRSKKEQKKTKKKQKEHLDGNDLLHSTKMTTIYLLYIAIFTFFICF